MAGKVDVYRIPPNFAEEGTLLSGRVRTRNAVETVFLEGALLYILASLNIGMKARIYLGVVVVIPTTILGLAGIQGESLSASIWHCLVFLKRRRILGTPTGRDRLEHNRRMRKAKVRERRKGGEKNRKRGRGTPEAAA
ncbi:MAG: hypothetical protein LUF27_01255 [Lachnospiraceae bacterium]|nr:hypothetical protein [Lachnospiraceae bacterium]